MTLIQIRRGTSAQWAASNPILGSGELGYDTTAKKYKTGDGVAVWTILPYDDATKANIDSPTFTGNVSGISKAMVGLGSVDNTSDVNKPVSSAVQAELANKAASNHGHDASALTSGTISDARLPGRLGSYAQAITDWNAARSTGWYMGSSIANQPPTPSGGWYIGTVVAHNDLYVTQTAYAFTADGPSDTFTWQRSCDNGTWGAWYRIRVSENELDIRYMGTPSPNASTEMRRDAAGRAQVALPAAANDIANKAYVDSLPGLSIWPTYLGTKVAFIGDSYSSGYGLTNPTTERWTKIFCNLAGISEYANTAVPSSGYVNEGSGGNSKFSTQATLIPTDCSTVIVLGGINDAPLAQTDTQMSTAVNNTITAIKTRSPGAKIVVISPMWHAGLPSQDLLRVERQIRASLPSDVTFIERGPWVRIDRTEWQIYDGHPNALGASAIASWVAAQLGYSPRGSKQCDILPPGTSDMALNQTNYPSWILGQDTIWNAKPGWWEYKAQIIMYNSSVNGSIWVQENNSRKISLRSDQTATLPTPIHRVDTQFWHPGGDLTFRFGYDPNNTNMMIITNGQTKAYAKWLSA